MFGSHLIKSWSTTQDLIALSSGEAEYYGLVKGSAIGLGIRSMMRDLGVNKGVKVKTDASAAIGIASRKGLGKVKHIEVHQLWVQSKVANGDIVLEKVKGPKKLADGLTKYVTSDGINMHLRGTNQYITPGRHELMPEVAS